jgi:hypothetical protein
MDRAGSEALLGFVVCHDRILPVDPDVGRLLWIHENQRTTLTAEDAEELQMQLEQENWRNVSM